jgi:pantoate kinase
MALTREKALIVFSIFLFLLGIGALIEQQLADNEFFKLADIAHHEVIAVSLWCVAIGILIGGFVMRYSPAFLMVGNVQVCPTCGQRLVYMPQGQLWYCNYCRHYYKPR